MTARQPHLPLTMEPSELLVVVAADLEFLTATFKGVDLALEAHKCCAYWNEKGGAKNWKLAYYNWLDGGRRRKAKSYESGRGMTPNTPPSDRMEYLRDAQRRGMA